MTRLPRHWPQNWPGESVPQQHQWSAPVDPIHRAQAMMAERGTPFHLPADPPDFTRYPGRTTQPHTFLAVPQQEQIAVSAIELVHT